MSGDGTPVGSADDLAAGGAPDAEATACFEAERPRLTGLAYRLLGSVTDAEDVVQEAWFRWARADRAVIEVPAAWLTTVVGRLGLDRLRSRQRDRAEYVGPWLPEPLVDSAIAPAAAATDPQAHAELADSLTTAFLVLLEQLTPTERLVVLLADVFDEPFATIAPIVGRSEAATRQIAVRARRKLHGAGDRAAAPRPAPGEQRRAAESFVLAIASGDRDAVLGLLAPEVVLVSDGGRARHAARHPVVGPDRVARFLVNIAKRLTAGAQIEFCSVNGSPGIVVRVDGRPDYVSAFDVGPDGIRAIHIVTNLDKLVAVDHHPMVE